MTKWQEVRLGDVCDVKGGKRLPKGVNLVTIKNTHPYIRVRDLDQGKRLQLNQNYEYVDDETQKIISHYIVSEDDVLISIVGTIGLIGIVGNSLNNANLTENCVKLINLRGIDKDFLYYFLISNSGQDAIKQGTVGAVQAKLPIKNIQTIQILLPPLDVQKKIAGVLGALDDKIELNNKINNNLEQQAQALFKSWFVDFEPFGGTMPKDWKNGKLGDFIEIKRGGSPRPIQEYLVPNGLNWLKISDATAETSPYILEIKEHIKPEGLNKTVFLKKGSLVLSNSATPGIPKFLDIDTCIHDGWLYFPNSLFSNEYLFLLFNHIRKDLISLGNGSVFTNLKTDILKNFEAILPTKEVLRRFDSIISSIFVSIKYNREEIATLTTLRDMLLPKLMSGEIDVSKVDINELNAADMLL